MSIVTRFAPSPTGFLHLGNLYSAWRAWRFADEAGGVLRLRLEDIDSSRCREAYALAIIEDLRWLGIDWHGEVRRQSDHLADYRAALATLQARALLYPCFCSRAEIARAQGAPHGDEPVYPGTCRHLSHQAREQRLDEGALYALPLDIARATAQAGALEFYEMDAGWVQAEPARFGDVVLARRDVPTSYHLCVVHDDAAQNVTHVIRGADLRDATHIHVLLQRLLHLPTPVYAHHKLLTGPDGKRLAKRDQAASLAALRAAGARPDDIMARLAAA